ncbi:MAG: BamA/TamA family outer membrane protein [Planctomycetaceae bacterium]|jgi:outer membrane protein insertion porin family|nr:BamA/TamA family outer membrane protein [Planctomycetaceae bacterium]
MTSQKDHLLQKSKTCTKTVVRFSAIVLLFIAFYAFSLSVAAQNPAAYNPSAPLQPTTTLQPVQPLAPYAANQPVYLNVPIVQNSAQLLQPEPQRLQNSNPVFDGEVEATLNNMQAINPSLQVQTFRDVNSAMIPTDLSESRPVESGNEIRRLQSQMNTTANPSQQFGVRTEKTLIEPQHEQNNFSDILQMQRETPMENLSQSGKRNPLNGNVFDSYRGEEKYPGSQNVDTLAQQPNSRELENLPVLEVIIEGNGQAPEHSIRNKIKTMTGYPFQSQIVQEDARKLRETGSFASVNPKIQRKPEGVVVIFELVERPVFYSVKFVGNKKITRTKLLEEAGIKAGDPVDSMLVLQAKDKIESFYRAEGFGRVNVYIASGDRSYDRNAVFIINEGGKQKILNTQFIGAHFLSQQRLKTFVESKPGMLYFIGGEFTREKLDEDVEKLMSFYNRHGFFDIQVDRDFDEGSGYFGLSEPGTWISVKFIISEGQRYKINDVKIIGNNLYTQEKLRKKFELKSGDYYLHDLMLRDRRSMEDMYGDKGYLYAKIQENVRFLEDGKVDIIYTIQEDKPVVINSIDIEFLNESHTKSTTILKRLFGLKPGSVPSRNIISRSQDALRREDFLDSRERPPTIEIVPLDKNGRTLDEERERDLEDLNVTRGQSPDSAPLEGTDPQRWNEMRQRNGIGATSAFPQQQVYRVNYPQPQESLVVSPSPVYGTQTYPTNAASVQQGSYAIPEQYKTPTTTSNPSTGYSGGNVQAGTTQGLSVSTNADGAPPLFGFLGGYDEQPAPALPLTNNESGAGSLLTSPDSPYASLSDASHGNPTNDLYRSANPVVPAISSPYDYYGSADYGSIAQTSGMASYPGDPAFGIPGAPGSITRPGNGLDDFSYGNAVIKVQEGRTGNVTLSVGVNSDSGLFGRIAVEERNFDWRRLPTNPFTVAGWRNAFRGGGQRFMIEAVPSENYQRYQASFQEPYLFNTLLSFGLNGFYYARYYDEWREHRIGGGASLGRKLSEQLSAKLTFNGANIKIYDPIYPIPDLMNVLGRNSQYAFGISGTYDTRNSFILPTQGGMLTVSAEQVLGTSRFVRGGYDARKYFTLWRRPDMSGPIVLGLRSVANVTEKNTPIYERYYAGGFSTIRGYEYRTVTPRLYALTGGGSAVSVGIGGNFEFYNSAEISFPISADDNIRGVVFVDTGTVETSIDKWESKYRVAPGVGFRLNIPMMGPVPIAFDFAFPVNSATGDVTQTFTFNMGFER